MSALTILHAAATFGCGLMAGLFFVFSNFAMQSLNTLHPESAIKAMQQINERILNPFFLVSFTGTALLSAIIIGATIYRGIESTSALILAGAVIYLLGVFLITVHCNVPLNDALKAIDSSSGTADNWRSYYEPWLFWNHVRTACSFFAFGLMLIARSLAS